MPKVTNTPEQLTNPKMKELLLEFDGRGEVKGYHFKQLHKSKKGFVYEVSSPGVIHYETFHRRENAQFGCVSYPGSNCFSIWAWTYRTLEEAMNKFNSF